MMLEICKSARKENNHLHLLKRVREKQYFNRAKGRKRKSKTVGTFLALITVSKFAVIAKTAISIIPPLKANSASGISVTTESAPSASTAVVSTTVSTSRSETTTSSPTTRVSTAVVP